MMSHHMGQSFAEIAYALEIFNINFTRHMMSLLF